MLLYRALIERHFNNRLNFRYWLLNVTREDSRFSLNILWTDEATFNSASRVNLHNTRRHYRSLNNGYLMQEIEFRGQWIINVDVVMKIIIIGPFIFDELPVKNNIMSCFTITVRKMFSTWRTPYSFCRSAVLPELTFLNR